MNRLAIVPYGVGIGDFVNMRPIIEGVRRARPDHVIHVVAPPELHWLLPGKVNPLIDVPGLEHWTRATPTSKIGTLSGRLSIRTTSRLEPLLLRRRLPAWLGAYLRQRGFVEVINCLQDFARLDLDRRWTSGPWNEKREHVIDLLCEDLETQGIEIGLADRPPRVPVDLPAVPDGYVMINPAAGMRLKEPLQTLWVEVATRLVSKGASVYFVQPPQRHIAEHIQMHVPGSKLLPPMSLPAMTRAIAAARLLVSPDTGLLHLAAAVGTPYVGLFGPTDPLFLGPYNHRLGAHVEAAINRPPVCRRCWTGQLLPQTRCAVFSAGSCTDLIGSTAVLNAIDSVLVRTFDRDPMHK